MGMTAPAPYSMKIRDVVEEAASLIVIENGIKNGNIAATMAEVTLKKSTILHT
jgi:hypothetical protein